MNRRTRQFVSVLLCVMLLIIGSFQVVHARPERSTPFKILTTVQDSINIASQGVEDQLAQVGTIFQRFISAILSSFKPAEIEKVTSTGSTVTHSENNTQGTSSSIQVGTIIEKIPEVKVVNSPSDNLMYSILNSLTARVSDLEHRSATVVNNYSGLSENQFNALADSVGKTTVITNTVTSGGSGGSGLDATAIKALFSGSSPIAYSNGTISVASGYTIPTTASTTEWANFVASGGGGGGSSQWTTNGTSIYYNDGSIGIGTASPSSDTKLEIVASNQEAIRIMSGASNAYTYLALGRDTVEGNIGIAANSGDFFTNASAGDFAIKNFAGGRILFGSGNSPASALSINSAGNVGIGILNPSNKLDVKGAAAFGSTYAGNATAVPSNSVAIEGSLGIGTISPDNLLSIGSASINSTGNIPGVSMDSGSVARYYSVGSGPYNNVHLGWVYNSGTPYATLATYSHSDPLRIDASTVALQSQSGGNVGIGTTSPSSKLHIYDATQAVARLEGVTNGGRLDFYEGAGSTLVGQLYMSSGGSAMQTITAAPISFITNQQLRMKIDGTTGYVGIGNNSPLSLLHVGAGTDTPFSSSSLYVSQAGTSILEVRDSSSDVSAFIQSSNSGSTVFGSLTNSALTFAVNAGEVGRFVTNGNFGIGTTTPGSKLTVAGDINFTGNLYQNGVLFSGGGGSSQWTTSGSDINYTTGRVAIGTTATSSLLTLAATSNSESPFNVLAYQADPSTNIIPIMTDYTAPSGVASAQSEFGGSPNAAAWHAFDNTGNIGDDWSTGAGWLSGGYPAWLKYEFPTAKVVNKYRISPLGTYTPSDWTFEGSNDNSSWTVLDTRTSQTGWSSAQTYTFTNTTAYTYYRINISAGPQFVTGVERLEMFESSLVPTSALAVGSSGLIGLNNGSAGAQLHINTNAASTKGLIVQGYSGQTADLQQWKSSSGVLNVIDANGNFGIGTTTPSSKLAVAGAIVSNGLLVQGVTGVNLGNADFAIRTGDGSGYWDFFTNQQANNNYSGQPAGSFGIYDAASDKVPFSLEHGAPTGALTVNASGNVGVGTTTPTAKFQVSHNASTHLSSYYVNNFDHVLEMDSAGGNLLSLKAAAGGAYNQIRFSDVGNGGLWKINIDSTGNVADFVIDNFSNQGLTLRRATGDAYFTSKVGIGTTTPDQALSVAGTIQSTSLYGGATTLSVDANGNIIRTPSDINLKENIENLDASSSLEKILKLQGVRYDFKDKNFGTGKQIGFIAQDVEQVVPEVVTSGGTYKSLNYGNLVALVVESIKQIASVFTKIENGVAHLKEVWFEGKVHINNDVCVDDVCITKDQFKNLLRNNGGNVTAPAAQTVVTPDPVDDATTTATSSEEVISSENSTSTVSESTSTESVEEQQTEPVEQPVPPSSESSGTPAPSDVAPTDGGSN